MKIQLLLLTCLLSTCLLSQKLYFIGEFSGNQFKQTHKNIDNLSDFKFYQKTTTNSKPIRIKSFKLNNIKLGHSNKPNDESIKAIVREFKNKSAKSEIVYITNTVFSPSTTRILSGTNDIITFEEFIKNSHKYQKTLNLFLLLNSRTNIDITNPISSTRITSLSFRIKGTGSSNYPITKIKYKIGKKNWEEITVDANTLSYEDGDEFSFDLSPSISEYDKKTLSLTLIFFNALDDTVQREIKDLTIVEPYISFENFYNDDHDLGTLLPKRVDHLQGYDKNTVGIVLEIHLNTNINFYNDEIKLNVEFFDENMGPLKFCTIQVGVIKCGLNSIIPKLTGASTPLPFVINGDEVYEDKLAIYKIIPDREDHLCGKAWNGYIRFSIPNSSVKTETMYLRLRGYNVEEKIKFPSIECR